MREGGREEGGGREGGGREGGIEGGIEGGREGEGREGGREERICKQGITPQIFSYRTHYGRLEISL